jgi:hypothetical protein
MKTKIIRVDISLANAIERLRQEESRKIGFNISKNKISEKVAKIIEDYNFNKTIPDKRVRFKL